MWLGRADADLVAPLPRPGIPPASGRTPSSAPLARRVLGLQRTAGNSAVGRLLARTPSHPMAKQLELADALNKEGLIDAMELSIMVDLTKADDKLRAKHLGYLRAIQAFEFSPRYHARSQKPAPLISQTDMDKVTTRRLIEGTIAGAGSLRLGYERVAKLKDPHAAEQLRLLQDDIKTVQQDFESRVKDNAYSFLEDSERRIANVLGSYGLVIAHADVAVSKVNFDEDELDDEVDKWLERARLGQKAAYEAKAANRASLGEEIDRLRALQKTVLKLQVAYMNVNRKVPLDAADRRRFDKRQQDDSEAAKLIFGNTVTPEQRSKEEEIQKADRELSTAWIEAERRHPVLAAHRGGQQRHLELIDLTGYGHSFAASGFDFLDEVNIRRAHAAQKRTTGPTHERAVVKEALRRLVNIHRTRLALRQKKLSFYKLEPVVAFTREQMLIHPRSVWRVAVDELVSPHKGPLAQGLEFVHDVFNIALLALAAIPNPLQPVAALYDVARSAYTTVDEYVKYKLQSAYSDTDLDKARSISSAEPSLTGFVVSLIATGMGVAQAVAVFKQAAAARRAMLEGSEAAQQTLNDLGKQHGLPGLGDELKNEAGIAGKGAKPPGSGQPKPPKPTTAGEPKPPLTEEPKPRTTAHPSKGASKSAKAPKKPPPLHPDLTTEERKALIRYTTADDVERGVLNGGGLAGDDIPTLAKLNSGTHRLNREMRELQEFIESLPPAARQQLLKDNERLMEVYQEFYATIRDPDKHAEFMAYIWHHATERRISAVQALEEIVAGKAKPHLVEDELLRADLLKDEPFLDMAFNGNTHGTHTHMYLEGLINFHHNGAGKGLRHLIAKAKGPKLMSGGRLRDFYSKFWDAMVDDYDPLEINSPDGLQAILERHLGFPRRIKRKPGR